MLILALGAVLLAVTLPAMRDGHNPDSYLRMVLAQQLWQGGDWFNHTFARTNPPFGMETPWTRPVDLLVLAGAVPLQQIMSVQNAFLVWGAVLPIAAFVVTGLLIYQVGGLLGFAAAGQLQAVALFAFSMLTPNTFYPLNVDHHFLLLIACLWLLAEVLVCLRMPENPGPPVRAGLALALGVWVSPEFLLPAAGVLAGLGCIWLLRPGSTGPILLRLLLTATGGLMVAVLLERTSPLAVIHDSVSIVHVTLFALLTLAATVLILLPCRLGVWRRGCAAGLGGGMVFLGMQLLFPQFWRAHYLATDAFVMRELLRFVAELQPVTKVPGGSSGIIILILAAAGACWTLYRLYLRDAAFDRQIWLVMLVTGLLLAVPSILQVRWMSGYGVAVLPLLAVPALEAARCRLQAFFKNKSLLVLERALLLGYPILFPLLLLNFAGALDSVRNPPASPAVERYNTCEQALIRFTKDDGFSRFGGTTRPLILMLPTNHAGVVWFWTPHSVVAGNYHRDTAGIHDVVTFFRADATTAHEILTRRKVDWIAYCDGDPMIGKEFFLKAGRPVPAWLEPVTSKLPSGLRLYRVKALPAS